MTRITESKNLASFCLNLLPKTNGAIEQKTNTTEIEKTLGIESKKKFDSKKAYSPIGLIESFKKYQSYWSWNQKNTPWCHHLSQRAWLSQNPSYRANHLKRLPRALSCGARAGGEEGENTL